MVGSPHPFPLGDGSFRGFQLGDYPGETLGEPVMNVSTNKARAFRADLDPSGVARAIYTNRVAV